jgi:hypothetical protein
MAQKVQTFLIDDLDGSHAEGTIRFGVDGADYEIDLSVSHAQQLRDALAPYISAARRTGTSPRRGGQKTTKPPDPTEVREWARSQGIDVKDRGRVPTELIVKFKAATGK